MANENEHNFGEVPLTPNNNQDKQQKPVNDAASLAQALKIFADAQQMDEFLFRLASYQLTQGARKKVHQDTIFTTFVEFKTRIMNGSISFLQLTKDVVNSNSVYGAGLTSLMDSIMNQPDIADPDKGAGSNFQPPPQKGKFGF